MPATRRPPHRRCLVADVARCVVSKPGQAPPRPHRPASALAHIAAELLNFACNSPATISNIEFTALKLQRFQMLLKLLPIELHATFLRPGPAAPSGSVVRFCVSRCARFLRCPPGRGCFEGLRERKIAPASHRVVVWGASVKEISPQHAENGWKLGILGVCGR